MKSDKLKKIPINFVKQSINGGKFKENMSLA